MCYIMWSKDIKPNIIRTAVDHYHRDRIGQIHIVCPPQNVLCEVNKIKESNKILKNEFNKLSTFNKKYNDKIEYLQNNIYKMDCRLIKTEQYSRREVISGIRNKIQQNNLENTVFDILRSFGMNDISSYDVCLSLVV